MGLPDQTLVHSDSHPGIVKALQEYEPQRTPTTRGARLASSFNSGISEYRVLLLSLIYFLVIRFFTPDLASTGNLRNIFSNMLPMLVAATGQTIVLITGGIDLSATSIIGLTSVLGALLMNSDTGALAGSAWATPVGMLVMLLGGGLIGCFNGLAIARLKMPAFIVTLTSMMFLSGLAIWLTKSRPIYNLPEGFSAVGQGSLFRIPTALMITLLVAIAVHMFLSRTLYGHWIYDVGMNAKASMVSGIPVHRVIVLAYTLSGICAAVSSILFTARLETGSPVLGQKILLDVIGAAVIGGTSLFGGQGKIIWTVWGVWFLCLIDNSLNLLGLSFAMVMMVKGAVILLASLMDVWRVRIMVRE